MSNVKAASDRRQGELTLIMMGTTVQSFLIANYLCTVFDVSKVQSVLPVEIYHS